MKILIVGSKSRIIHLNHFSHELEKFGVECKVIMDTDFLEKSLSLNLKKKIAPNKKLKILLNTFAPNIVLLDNVSRLAKTVLDEKIPLFLLFRGNYWEQLEWAKKTIYKSPLKFVSVLKDQKLADRIFKESSMILPISEYMKNEFQMRYSKDKIEVFPADGRNVSDWIQVENQKLTHPCVGLVQGFNIWGKTRELNTLQDVMRKLPNVTFYLAGDGIYRDKIIPKLKKFENFVWMGNLEYPNEVKKFFSSIDLYLILSGLEGLGQSIIESMLMKKPVIASNIGGIPEIVIDRETGFLVNLGDSDQIVHLINVLLSKPDLVKKITTKAEESVKVNYSWEFLAKKFSDILEKHHYK
jgi:glycosyltransferase involved in cell wall biosynthesis